MSSFSNSKIAGSIIPSSKIIAPIISETLLEKIEQEQNEKQKHKK
ncbi:hypothetical protein NIES4101_87800 [Calothrix sp. NIES-4101]|nr:hypothetical protein NIES4101_87800 [Calothrix sp. NIES-4101]